MWGLEIRVEGFLELEVQGIEGYYTGHTRVNRIEVSPNGGREYLSGGLCSKDNNVLGSIFGSPRLWKRPQPRSFIK